MLSPGPCFGFEQYHVWLRFIKFWHRDRSSWPYFEPAFFVLTEDVVELFEDELMFGTNGGHLDEKTVDQFYAVVWVKDSSLAELVVFLDREFSQGHFWFFDRAVENRCGHRRAV